MPAAANAASKCTTSVAEPVTLRRLVAEDLARYKALRDTMLATDPHAFTSDAEGEAGKSAASYVARLGLDRPEGGQFTIGAWRESRLVGAISCDRDSRLKVKHIGHLIGMMVQPDERGSGIGRALLAAGIEAARRADGLELLTLTVTAGNRPAVRLYEAAGFVRYGTLQRAIKVGEQYFDKDLMSLVL
jgi:ribosomal protein S18 acetylase RimI-like enzyme